MNETTKKNCAYYLESNGRKITSVVLTKPSDETNKMKKQMGPATNEQSFDSTKTRN